MYNKIKVKKGLYIDMVKERSTKIKIPKDKRQETYNKFKEDYLRICKELNKEAISSREYDHYNNFMCRKVLYRELGKPFNEILKEVGLKPLREFITPDMSEEINKRILELRLQEKSYLDISIELDIVDLSIQSIKRRLDKIYEESNDEVKVELDRIKTLTKRGRYWQVLKQGL